MDMSKFDTQSFIAISSVAAVIALAFVLVFVKAPDSDVFKMIVGGLMTVGFANVFGFYFGSSAGSKQKDDALSAALGKTNGAEVPATTTVPATTK